MCYQTGCFICRKLIGSSIGRITSTSTRHENINMWPSPDGKRDEENYGVARLREGKTGQQAGRSSILLLVACNQYASG